MPITSPWIKTAAQWTAQDPYLPLDVQCIESDTGKSKLGLGNKWSATTYEPSDESSPTVTTLTYGATVTTDASLGHIFDLTLTGNVILANPTNPVNGKTIRWRITQDGTGSRTVTLGGKFNIPSSGSDPLPWSTAADACDILAATYHEGRDQWDVVAFVPGY